MYVCVAVVVVVVVVVMMMMMMMMMDGTSKSRVHFGRSEGKRITGSEDRRIRG